MDHWKDVWRFASGILIKYIYIMYWKKLMLFCCPPHAHPQLWDSNFLTFSLYSFSLWRKHSFHCTWKLTGDGVTYLRRQQKSVGLFWCILITHRLFLCAFSSIFLIFWWPGRKWFLLWGHKYVRRKRVWNYRSIASILHKCLFYHFLPFLSDRTLSLVTSFFQNIFAYIVFKLF